eukprot:Pompholyxophrys_punicea_v1_NODE_382_length_2088_cov_8.177570.p2 type:complete len:125 gc:universal NODE_382_length_2088_cov_8.177570:1916-1542(-)
MPSSRMYRLSSNGLKPILLISIVCMLCLYDRNDIILTLFSVSDKIASKYMLCLISCLTTLRLIPLATFLAFEGASATERESIEQVEVSATSWEYILARSPVNSIIGLLPHSSFILRTTFSFFLL